MGNQTYNICILGYYIYKNTYLYLKLRGNILNIHSINNKKIVLIAKYEIKFTIYLSASVSVFAAYNEETQSRYHGRQSSCQVLV